MRTGTNSFPLAWMKWYDTTISKRLLKHKVQCLREIANQTDQIFFIRLFPTFGLRYSNPNAPQIYVSLTICNQKWWWKHLCCEIPNFNLFSRFLIRIIHDDFFRIENIAENASKGDLFPLPFYFASLYCCCLLMNDENTKLRVDDLFFPRSSQC